MVKYDLETLDIVHELQIRGLYGSVLSSGKYKCICAFHDDSEPSMVVRIKESKINANDSIGLFYCYGCQKGGDFFTLIAELEGIERHEAIALFFDEDYINSIEYFTNNVLKHLNAFNSSGEKEKPKYVSVDKYSKLKKPKGKYLEYLHSRKLEDEIIDLYDLRIADKKSKYKNRIWFPYIDENGKILTMKARSILKNAKNKMISLKSAQHKKVLFGINQALQITNKFCVLVEGEIDAIYLRQFGIPAVSSGNTYLSNKQLLQIIKNFEYLYLCYDGDMYSGNEQKELVMKNLRERLIEYIDYEEIILPIDKDPNELNEYEVREIFKNLIVEKEEYEYCT